MLGWLFWWHDFSSEQLALQQLVANLLENYPEILDPGFVLIFQGPSVWHSHREGGENEALQGVHESSNVCVYAYVCTSSVYIQEICECNQVPSNLWSAWDHLRVYGTYLSRYKLHFSVYCLYFMLAYGTPKEEKGEGEKPEEREAV